MKRPTFFFNLLKGQEVSLLFEHSLDYKQQTIVIFKPNRAIENTATVPPPPHLPKKSLELNTTLVSLHNASLQDYRREGSNRYKYPN